MSSTARPRFLWKATSLTPRLGRCEIVLAAIPAISGDLPRRHVATQIAGHQAHTRQCTLSVWQLSQLLENVPDTDTDYSGLAFHLSHSRQRKPLHCFIHP